MDENYYRQLYGDPDRRERPPELKLPLRTRIEVGAIVVGVVVVVIIGVLVVRAAVLLS